MSREVYFLVTVDGDLRVGDAAQQRAGVEAMRAIHADLGIVGRTTWFINPVDFDWTGTHSDLLLSLADSGETLGLHDHLDTHYAETYDDILALMARARRLLSDFFAAAGRDVPLLAHRSGCFQQSEAAYRAAQQLGYRWCSDVWPGTALYARMVCDGPMPNPWRRLDRDEGGILTDNTMIPLNGTPWRHDASNWLEVTSRSGHFLHLPVTCAPVIDWERIYAALSGAGKQAFLVLDTHPYDLQDPTTAAVDPPTVAHFARDLQRVRDELAAEFVRLDQVESLWIA